MNDLLQAQSHTRWWRRTQKASHTEGHPALVPNRSSGYCKPPDYVAVMRKQPKTPESGGLLAAFVFIATALHGCAHTQDSKLRAFSADRGIKMKSIKLNLISLVIFMTTVLLAEVGLAQDWSTPAYTADQYTSTECFEATEDCDHIGHIESLCGEEYLCAAPNDSNELGAVGADPTFRECVDQCFRDFIADKSACDADYQRDITFCDRNSKGYWNDTCRYLAHQTWNLCVTVASADLAGCQGGCGISGPIKGIWKKIIK